MEKNDLRTTLIALLCSIIAVGVYHFGTTLCRICDKNCHMPPCGGVVLVKVIDDEEDCPDMQCQKHHCHAHALACQHHEAACPMHQGMSKDANHAHCCPAMQQTCPVHRVVNCPAGANCPHHGGAVNPAPKAMQAPCPAGKPEYAQEKKAVDSSANAEKSAKAQEKDDD